MSKRYSLLLFAILPLVIIGAVLAFADYNYNQSFLSYKLPDAGSGPTTDSSYVGIPKHVSIPAIGVESSIEPAGLASDGTLAVPKGPYDVTWYNLGPRPGQQGSAIISGHYGPWISGSNSVFDKLGNLKPGDKIYITDENGKTLTFYVTKTKTYGLNDTPSEVFAKDDGAYLNLVTCHGDWLKDQKTYTNRLVVFTVLEN